VDGEEVEVVVVSGEDGAGGAVLAEVGAGGRQQVGPALHAVREGVGRQPEALRRHGRHGRHRRQHLHTTGTGGGEKGVSASAGGRAWFRRFGEPALRVLRADMCSNAVWRYRGMLCMRQAKPLGTLLPQSSMVSVHSGNSGGTTGSMFSCGNLDCGGRGPCTRR
jgi:hypothetical protein